MKREKNENEKWKKKLVFYHLILCYHQNVSSKMFILSNRETNVVIHVCFPQKKCIVWAIKSSKLLPFQVLPKKQGKMLVMTISFPQNRDLFVENMQSIANFAHILSHNSGVWTFFYIFVVVGGKAGAYSLP